jgi:hypothetical protein
MTDFFICLIRITTNNIILHLNGLTSIIPLICSFINNNQLKIKAMSYDLINTDDFSRLIRTINKLKVQLSKTLEKSFSQKWIDGVTICKMLGICNRTLFDVKNQEN